MVTQIIQRKAGIMDVVGYFGGIGAGCLVGYSLATSADFRVRLALGAIGLVSIIGIYVVMDL